MTAHTKGNNGSKTGSKLFLLHHSLPRHHTHPILLKLFRLQGFATTIVITALHYKRYTLLLLLDTLTDSHTPYTSHRHMSQDVRYRTTSPHTIHQYITYAQSNILVTLDPEITPGIRWLVSVVVAKLYKIV